MYVCLCMRVNDKQVRQAVLEGACTVRELSKDLGIATQCGRCACHAKELLNQCLGKKQCSKKQECLREEPSSNTPMIAKIAMTDNFSYSPQS